MPRDAGDIYISRLRVYVYVVLEFHHFFFFFAPYHEDDIRFVNRKRMRPERVFTFFSEDM